MGHGRAVRRRAEGRAIRSPSLAPRAVQSFSVTHRVPGRLRLRVPELARRPALAPRIESVLMALDVVQRVRCNPVCASVVLYHQGPRAPARADMARALAPLVAQPRPGEALVPVTLGRADPAVARGRERQRRDCLLCRVKLALARLLVKDLWRCWRQEQGLRERRDGRRAGAGETLPSRWDVEGDGPLWRRRSLQEPGAPPRSDWTWRLLRTLVGARPV